MKKKTGVILSSVAAIAVSASVIAGSTYALFTSEDKVDITVSSANVEVSASVTGATLNRPTSINADTYAATYAEEGTALSDVSGKEISLDDIQPGDKITLNLLIESESTVNFKYRVSLVKTGGDQNLYENLLVGIDGSYYGDYVSAWTDFSETTEAGKPITVKQSTVEILMPAYLGNEYKNLSCNVALKVEAVQGNVDKTAETGTEKKVYPVYSQDDLTAALAGVGEGETIVVMQKWNGVTINMSDATEAVEFGVKGCDVGTLTVNAPSASIHYDIGKTEVVEITAVANNSFHVSGEIAALNVSEGRVVFEEGAKVPTATFNVAADKSAKMEVLKGAEVGFIDDNNSAGTIVIDAVNGKVSEVANELLNNEKVTVTGYNLVSTEEQLVAAIAKGGNITLVADLTVNKTIYVSKDVVLDLNGHTVTNNVTGGRPLYINAAGVTLEIDGEVDSSGMVIPVENTNSYGFVDMQAENVTVIVNGGTYTGNTDVAGFFKPRKNGWNITLNNVIADTNYQIVGCNVDGRLTVKGGEYTLTANNNFAGFYLQATTLEDSGDALISSFEGVKIYSESRLCVEVAGSKATFKDCNFGNPDNRTDRPWLATSVAVDYMGNATIESGTYSGGMGVFIYSSGGTITINGGTFTGSKADVQADKGEIILNNATLTNNTKVANGDGVITDNRD